MNELERKREIALRELFNVVCKECLIASDKEEANFNKVSNAIVGVWVDGFITDKERDKFCELVDKARASNQADKELNKLMNKINRLYRY